MRGGMEGPVNKSWSQAILAGATFNALDEWDYETPDVDVGVEVNDRATAVGLVRVVKSGGLAITQESPVQSGGTAGQLPPRLSTEPQVGEGYASKKLAVFYRNPTAGTITVDGWIVAVPKARSFGGGARRAPPRRFRRRR